jgi:hypothetical protein
MALTFKEEVIVLENIKASPRSVKDFLKILEQTKQESFDQSVSNH